MRKASLFIGLIQVFAIALMGQEHQMHLASLRQAPFKQVTKQGIMGDSAFVEYVLTYLLEAPEDEMFISNRELLPALCVSYCSSSEIVIHDTLDKKRKLDISIRLSPFDSAAHSYLYYEGQERLIKAIDGMQVYGAVDYLPRVQIDSISITWGKRELKIPREAYEDLYDPTTCFSNPIFHQPLSAFLSRDGEYLYVYIYGGRSTGIYFAKLIFDRKRYIKKIVAEYEDLLPYGALRPDFLGF